MAKKKKPATTKGGRREYTNEFKEEAVQMLLWHLHRTVQTDPDAGWVFVVDQLNVHCSASLVLWIARLEGIDPESLGKKGKHGVLKSMASRQEFLSDPSHRIRFVFLPKHSSWLNQIEIVFGIVNRRIMRHSSFASQAELKSRLKEFIAYFNETFARPFNWQYTGRTDPSATVNMEGRLGRQIASRESYGSGGLTTSNSDTSLLKPCVFRFL